jgi:hypothetical protein
MQRNQEARLRSLIRTIILQEGIAGSQPEEKYDTELLDDPKYAEGSVYVPDDIKGKIRKWAKSMGLYTGKRA